ncbi:MAG: lipoyl synthase [Candidatus Bipolaricaulota bacterium]|nr:lipoyl synthase [Candidatus Bipolaricaulota bacterium]
MAERKPDWLRVSVPSSSAFPGVDEALRRWRVGTVCRSARCPNLPTCWGNGTATFMVLGEVCTRGCAFCAVAHGRPAPPDPDEPERVAKAAAELGLRYVVLTSVDRDDLPDGGADHFARAIRALRAEVPHATVEALIPDFGGSREALEAVVGAGPHVVGHNLETVRRLTPSVRDRRAGYDRSLAVLRTLKDLDPGLVTKSSLLLGLGETDEEIEEALGDLRAVGVEVVVLGQYLRPTPRQVPVRRYVPPEEFARWETRARGLGFRAVVASPLARTSFRAAETFASR